MKKSKLKKAFKNLLKNNPHCADYIKQRAKEHGIELDG